MSDDIFTLNPGNPNSRSCISIKGLDLLEELALNLTWSWNLNSADVWRQLDAPLWHLTHNPWIVLQTIS